LLHDFGSIEKSNEIKCFGQSRKKERPKNVGAGQKQHMQRVFWAVGILKLGTIKEKTSPCRNGGKYQVTNY